MEEIITRKFFKPLKGSGELLKSGQHVAAVRYYLQGWQDFPATSAREEIKAGPAQLSGMGGEVTLRREDRSRVSVEELVGKKFILHTEKHADYEVMVYKVKENDPDKGQYSVRCNLPEQNGKKVD